jgi:hypothetical protein
LEGRVYDHYLRNPSQLSRAIAYIEQNPVSAGLVCSGTLALVQRRVAGDTACPTKPDRSLSQNVQTPEPAESRLQPGLAAPLF